MLKSTVAIGAFFVALAWTSACLAANWVIATAPSVTPALYYDSTSIVRSGNTAQVGVLENNTGSVSASDGSFNYVSSFAVYDFDCGQHTITSVSQMTYYSGQWLSGTVVHQYSERIATNHAVQPGSANDDMLRGACGY